MKKFNMKLIALVSALCMVLLVGCGSFDTSGYVQSVLDNSFKGDSAKLIEFSKSSEEDVKAIYEESIQNNLDSLLTGVELDEELTNSYRDFVVEMLSKAKYEVGESTKNDDGSYTVPVTTYALTLNVGTSIDDKTNAYITELQDTYANGGEVPSTEEMTAETYKIMLECLTDALATAEYGEAVENTVTVSIQNKVYTPAQSDLDNISLQLFSVQ